MSARGVARMWFRKEPKPVEKLIDGYLKFRRTTFARERGRYERLAEKGQNPKILIVACSDSRVSPSIIFNTPPGAIFVARNIANIVPPHDPDGRPRSIGAAVEYAVKVLNVTDIIVKGHARCGGVAALMNGGEGLPATDYLKPWVEVAAPARMLFPPNFDKLNPTEKRRVAERAVIQNSIMNLSGFPWVQERLETGALKVHGWHFDMHDGRLMRLDHESGDWVDVK
jgi:carbonic anhydrase